MVVAVAAFLDQGLAALAPSRMAPSAGRRNGLIGAMTEDHRCGRRIRYATDAVHQGDLGLLYLAVASLAAKLTDSLDHQ
jgi:hypothetical protein